MKSEPAATGPVNRAFTTAWPRRTATTTPITAAPSVIPTPRGVRRAPRNSAAPVSSPPTVDTAANAAVATKKLSR
ncbi:hypothetical protein AXK61_01560 [Tsukamurella pseudospumae]|uniref:Uncharacterized protein n=1 Tax=Tsukamurella pseudospumae TaxID=239498 RepID=A0A137ZTM2_9ACTN|nr:hypothetical protein AXK61_01560 [Tsukamurella pseudospumae]